MPPDNRAAAARGGIKYGRCERCGQNRPGPNPQQTRGQPAAPFFCSSCLAVLKKQQRSK
jgi:hypothetical protein